MDLKNTLLRFSAGNQGGGLQPHLMGRIKPPRFSLYFIAGCLCIAFVVLLFLINVEAVVNGKGAVQTESGLQSVKTQEGGIVESVAVIQGQRVVANQELAVLSNTTLVADRTEIENELKLLNIKKYRLDAEREGRSELTWPEQFKDDPKSLKDDQYALFEARRDRQKSEMEGLESQSQTLKRDLTGAQDELVAMQEENRTAKEILDFQMEGRAKGWVSKADALRSQNQYAQIAHELVKIKTRIPSLTSQIQEAQKKYDEAKFKQAQQTLDDLEEVTLRMRTLEATIRSASDKDDRRILRAPQAGIINKVHITGPGDVVKPGDPVFDIVAVDQGQVIQARIDPSLRRGLYIGLPAKVTFTALQDLRVPPIDAKVVFVAADTQTDPEGHTYYEVHVQTGTATIKLPNGQETVIEPGMQANVSIVVGSHTLADFLLRPLEWAARNAFRER